MTRSDRELLETAKGIREAVRFQQSAKDVGCPDPDHGLCADRLVAAADKRIDELLQQLLTVSEAQ